MCKSRDACCMHWYVSEWTVWIGEKALFVQCVCIWWVLDVRGWPCVSITNVRGVKSRGYQKSQRWEHQSWWVLQNPAFIYKETVTALFIYRIKTRFFHDVTLNVWLSLNIEINKILRNDISCALRHEDGMFCVGLGLEFKTPKDVYCS